MPTLDLILLIVLAAVACIPLACAVAGPLDALPYREVWALDTEFRCPPGERPDVHCLCARELRTGRELRTWREDLRALRVSPIPTGADALHVAFYSCAEWSSYLALGWPLPERVLDLFAEMRNVSNGLPTPCGSGLLGALTYFGLPGIAAATKDEGRALAIRGAPFTGAERSELLDYCMSDVEALARLLPAMLPRIDLPRAVGVRGRFMTAVAKMEHAGTPIDAATLARLRRHWRRIQERLIDAVAQDYPGVYEGRAFRAAGWETWLRDRGIPWPRLESGRLALDDDTWREMSRSRPEVAPMRELRHALSEMRLEDLAVGGDGRNRCMLSPFRSRTGRNQPGNSSFIFGPAVWLRSLIRPAPGMALAYVDWSAAEFGIAAALSGDGAMVADYASGDPYLGFGRRAGLVPPTASKVTHRADRNRLKVALLAIQYGMQAQSLADRLGCSPAHARELLDLHRRVYARYWAWSDGVQDTATLLGKLRTCYGWTLHVGSDARATALRNWPIQSAGSEMMRVACIVATEAGIRVCCPVHDALLVEAPAGELDDVVAETRRIMAAASSAVLGGVLALRTDATVTRWPGRYSDARGRVMWARVMGLLDRVEAEAGSAPDPAAREAVEDPVEATADAP